MTRMRLALLATLAATCPALTAHADEELERSADNLLFDLQKVVELQQASGWKIDRYEYEEMMPDALLSVCRATEALRAHAQGRISAEVLALGGPLEQALPSVDYDVSELEPLLFATRVEQTLAEAIRRAPAECPVWIRPVPEFRSLQTGVDRFTLTFEGGGTALIQYAPRPAPGTSALTLGGGGGGRLLVGRGFSHVWSVRAGAEFGAAALVRRGQVGTSLPLQFLGAIPVVVRYTDVSWHYNAEVAALGLVEEEGGSLRYGARAGVMLGISTLQVRSFIPWVGFGAAVELFPEAAGRPTLMNVKGGVRAGVDWDFGAL